MFKEQEQWNRLQTTTTSSRSLNPHAALQIHDPHCEMLPTTTTTVDANHRKIPLVHLHRLTRMPSAVTIERCTFLLVHFIFYLIILTIVYIRLEQFNRKQEHLLSHLRLKDNLTRHDAHSHHTPRAQHVTPSDNQANCSCVTVSYPQQNRTTRCFQLRVGLNDTMENVFCPMSNKYHERPWLRIQQRESNAVDFNRTWTDYRRGFGHVSNHTDFWIGNENLHWLTNTYLCRLKVELTDWYNETRSAIYETFRVANQQDGYRIQIADYHGDMETSNKFDSFSRRHHNARFSTYDHYATSLNCPQLHSGSGWWYHSGADCAHVQLNGRLATHSDGLVPLNTGILWIGWKGDRHYSFQRVHMAIQPKSRRPRSTH